MSTDVGLFIAEEVAITSSDAIVDDSVLKNAGAEDGENALRLYSQSFKNNEDSECLMFNRRKAFPWGRQGSRDKQSNLSDRELRAELQQELSNEPNPQDGLARGRTLATDTDDELVPLCCQCGLPLGDLVYEVDALRRAFVHGECMAQRVVKDMRKEDQEQQKKECALKSHRRRLFGIGWQIASVPRNIGAAEKMQCQFAPKGMCCLALAGSRAVSVLPTLEPACAVNLAYLSIALRVRHKEGREPFFSLDPLDANKDSMQVKRFEPEWLAGTCVGDVLFQADYYLKELSFGEYEQPVVGMKSCFDHSFGEEHDKQWRAREWFVVRKAEALLSQDNVIIPYVRMGVEAWEQVEGPDGTLQDAKVTRHNHPLVRYAEEFTHNFDLIAERKSVIFHLRELAKASVLAKYLFDASIYFPEDWLEAGGVVEETSPDPKSLEVPQLWNERAYGTIRLRSGAIVQDNCGLGTKSYGLYGGVNFGLDRFSVATPGRASRAMLQGLQVRPVAAPDRAARAMLSGPRARITVDAPGRATRAMLQGLQVGPGVFAPATSQMRAPGIRGVDPRGVDLNLNKFDLSTATRVASEVAAPQVAQDACAAIGPAFWSNLDNIDVSVFKKEDRLLLAGLFNRRLSDRRDDGDQFVPPDTSFTYMERIANLMKEEQAVLAQRKNLFFSKKFLAECPGPLFPSSWKDYIDIERKTISSPDECMLHERPDYISQPNILDHVLQSETPVFDKISEEGVRFRVYKVGSLEVRTTQELDGKETVGAVFSISPSGEGPGQRKKWQKADFTDTVKKVTTFVEKDRELKSRHRYYVVLETENNKTIVTEMNANGFIDWKESPADLEDRNSLAKVFRSKDCGDKAITIRDMRSSLAQVAASWHWQARSSHSTGKRYAQCAYNRALAADTPSTEVQTTTSSQHVERDRD